jgi:hypothetical protein
MKMQHVSEKSIFRTQFTHIMVAVFVFISGVVQSETAGATPLTGDFLCATGVEISPSWTLADGAYYSVSNGILLDGSACSGSVVLVSGITEIGNYAFAPTLESINLPDGLETIGVGAFSSTSLLEEITFPDSLTSIGNNAFEGSGLTAVVLNGPDVTIGVGSFQQMGQLRSVVIGSGVTNIPDVTFYNNFGGSIQNLTLGNSITSIGGSAFLGAQITSLVIPDSVTSIGGSAFGENVLLTKIEIGRNVTTMDAGIFYSSNLGDVNARVYYCGSNARPQAYAYDNYPSGPSCSAPESPTIGLATALSSTTAAVSFSAPIIMGGESASSYSVSVWNESLSDLIKTQTFSSDLPERGQTTTVTITGLARSSTYKFKVTAINSRGTSVESAATNSITTPVGTTIPSAPTITQVTAGDRSLSVNYTGGNSGGGTISSYKYSLNGGSFIAIGLANPITLNNLVGYQNYSVRLIATNEVGDSSPSNAASAVTLDFAQDKARKDARELSEILTLVPSIAGLSQSIAGLGNSLLLPKKCVKGKLVKNVKAGAKCPKGYKARK